jgi:hypothetical protein
MPLWYTCVTSPTPHPLALAGEAIKVNHGLEELMLNGNSFGDDGARHLMNALKLNNTLQVGLTTRRGCDMLPWYS